MASPIRSFGTAGQRTGREGCNPEPLNPQLPVLNVAPLNSVPYIGPPTAHSNLNTASVPQEAENKAVVKVGSSLIYMPSGLSEEERTKLVVATRCGVGLSNAAMGKIGPIIGLIDIGECEDSYIFCVSLPGVSRDEKDFSCNVEPDGKILIKGVTTTGEKTVVKESQIFKMQTQNLCPPGHFSVSFQLPGPVDHQQLSGYFDNTGILEGIVKKK